MGAFGKAFAAYTQPLIDDSDGSEDQLQKAFMFGQVCWNLALVSEEARQETFDDLKQTFKMDNEEFETFKASVISPMIQRHYDMFPHMHEPDTPDVYESPSPGRREPTISAVAEKHPGVSPNAPCPCNSGKKYKRCCGKVT